jgi:hypothetical protein
MLMKSFGPIKLNCSDDIWVPSCCDQEYLVVLEPKLPRLGNLRNTATLQLEVCLENKTYQYSIIQNRREIT